MVIFSAYSRASFSIAEKSSLSRQIGTWRILSSVAPARPTGCIDAFQKGTAIDQGDTQVHQRQERRRELSRPFDGSGELLGRLQDRPVRIDLGAIEEAAEDLALLGEDLLQDGIAAVVDLPPWPGCSPLGSRTCDAAVMLLKARARRAPRRAGGGARRPPARCDLAPRARSLGACAMATPRPAISTISRSLSWSPNRHRSSQQAEVR